MTCRLSQHIKRLSSVASFRVGYLAACYAAIMLGVADSSLAQETGSPSAAVTATSLLFPAVVEGPPELVQVLISAGADLEVRDSQRRTPLMVAVDTSEHRDSSTRGTERVRLIKSLIDAGANVNARDRTGNTPLMYAAKYDGTSTVVDMLIGGGADVGATERYGDTALHDAAAWNDDPSVSMTLILAGADVNAADWQQETPLMQAAEFGSAAVVQALLDAGADINARDGDGRTALEIAENRPSYRGEAENAEVVRLLSNASTSN